MNSNPDNAPGDIPPAALTAYAVAHGWTPAKNIADIADLYTHPDSAAVVIPTVREAHTARQYADDVACLIRNFAAATGHSVARVRRDLAHYDCDALTVVATRVLRAAVHDSADDIADVAAFLRHIGNAVACASPPEPDPDRALRLRAVRRVADGMSVSLRTPPLAAETAADDPPENRPAVAVMRTLAAVREFVLRRRAGESPDAVAVAIHRSGVNDEICNALSYAAEHFGPLHFAARYALHLPCPSAPADCFFTPADADTLRDIHSHGMERTKVFGIPRPSDPPEKRGIALYSHKYEQVCVVETVLDAADYAAVAAAAQAGRPVVIAGRLQPAGEFGQRRWRLDGASLDSVVDTAA